MLIQESYWFKATIEKYINPGSLVIIIGSSTKTFREKIQPHIYENIYRPLEIKKCKIINVDLKKDEGVDLSGDITDPVFLSQLRNIEADVVICSNLLEHILKRKDFIDSLSALIKENGKLIVSVPRSYPYHSDPIDTLYRPNIEQLSKEFIDFQLIEGEIVKSGKIYNTWYGSYPRNRRILQYLQDCLRAILKFNREKLNLYKWLFLDISVTCCIYFKLKT